MLFIYGSLRMGGIETFFLRMARERSLKGLETYVLLLSNPNESNKGLLDEMTNYAEVIFPKDVFLSPAFVSEKFPLFAPVKKNILKMVFSEVTQIHVFDGMHALLGYRFLKILNIDLPITVGFYHYIKYLWGEGEVAFYERVNRDFVFNFLPRESLMFFSEGNRELYEKKKNMSFNRSNTFRLGVVDKKEVSFSSKKSETVKIVTVGRLVDFKTYNFFMVDVIKNLIEKGYKVEFDIYGDGPSYKVIKEKVNIENLGAYICLKGVLDYSEFDDVVGKYDLFIGSGTAIIQAASLGVPCIVGIENMVEPLTYGFFCDVYDYEYNMKGLEIPLLSVEELIINYYSISDSDCSIIKDKHIKSIEAFTNESCQRSMDELNSISMPSEVFKYNKFFYELSRVFDHLNMKINDNHPRLRQFDEFKGL